MKAQRWVQCTMIASLAALTLHAVARAETAATQTRMVAGGATSNTALAFASVVLGGPSQTLTANFSFTGVAAVVPSFTLHYGREFSLSTPRCQLAGQSETCSVDISFAPALPGLRPDALFVSAAGARLATIPLSGTGLAPLLQLRTNSSAGATVLSGSLTGSADAAVVDENGTAYLLDETLARITAVTASGQTTVLPVTGLVSPRALLMDGAGVLYILPSSADASLISFDTVLGQQRSITLPVASSAVDAMALRPDATLALLSESRQTLYTSASDGTWSSTPLQQLSDSVGLLSPRAILAGPGYLASSSDSLLQVTSSGGQSHLAPSGSTSTDAAQPRQTVSTPSPLLGIDAAGTLYLASSQSTVGLSAPSFSAAVVSLPSASALAADGSLYLAGSGSLSYLSAAKSVIDLGTVQQGSRAQQVATLYNAGNQPLAISAVTASGSGFTVEPASSNGCIAGDSLASGASCNLLVSLVASQLGSATGSLSISSDSLQQPASVQTFSVVAHAVPVSQASFSPTSLVFPATTQNVPSTPLPVVLTNTGAVTLNISSIAITGTGGGSYSQTNNCQAQLAAGSQCTINVTFTPLGTGSITASLSVVDDQGGITGSTQTVGLSGTGSAAPAPVIALTVASKVVTSLTFGSGTSTTTDVVAGTAGPTQTFVVSNTGNATANISSITLTTALTVQAYSFTTTCGSTLTAGNSCNITVGFLPPSAGTFTGTILIADNAAGTPQPMALTGTGTAGDFNLTSTQTSITIPSSGGSGSFVMTATPDPAPYPTPVVFTAFGIPLGATYNFNPGSISPETAPATANLNIQLPAYVNNTISERGESPLNRRSLPLSALVLAGLALGLRRRRVPWLLRASAALLLAVAGLGFVSLSGCTGSGIPLTQGVAPGTYTITVTGQSANGAPASTQFPTTHSVTFNLIVQ